MKKKNIFILLIIVIIILVTYIIYNIYLRIDKKIDYGMSFNKKEKITSSDLRIGITNFDTMNPIISDNTNVQYISKLIYEPLIDLDYDYKLKGCLATEWNKIDSNSYLIRLRENVKWHDGKKFDSDDVIFTVNMIKNFKEKSVYYYNVENVQEIKKIDENTIRIVTDKEIPYFEYYLIFPIISSKYYTEDKFINKKFNLNPVGTGMYYVENNNKENINLRVNEHWWQDKDLRIDNITLNLYNDLNEEINAIQKNRLDLIISNLIDIDKYINETKCNLKTFIGRKYNYIAINCNENLLKNKNLRQAIKYSINVDDILEKIFNSKYIKSEFPLDFGNYLYNKNKNKTEYNLEEAREILTKSKLKNINLKLLVNKDDYKKIDVAKLIKSQLNEIGINIDIIEKIKKEYYNDLINKKFDLAIISNTYSFSPLLNSYFEEGNLSGYRNNEILKVLKRIENESEEDSKKSIEEIIKYYNEDVPYISLFYDTSTIVYSKNLKGDITPNCYNVFYNIENWYREFDK